MFKKILWVFAGLFLAAQFIRPDPAVPVVGAAVNFETIAAVPPDVLSILKNACYDCHSYETKYPWYAQVSPVSWWLSNHINEGREHLNFSTFGKLPSAERSEALGEAAEAVQEGKMPLPSYTWLGLHPEANLSAGQRHALLQWLNANGGDNQEAGGKEEHDD